MLFPIIYDPLNHNWEVSVFSVVIPTMQASPLLWPLLQSFQAHSLVDEILIVNNSDRPLDQPVGLLHG